MVKRQAKHHAEIQPYTAGQDADPELNSASLPNRGRAIIRKPEMTRRITAAAKSRAPRISLTDSTPDHTPLQPPAPVPLIVPNRALATGS